jgi:hypothetical protein
MLLLLKPKRDLLHKEGEFAMVLSLTGGERVESDKHKRGENDNKYERDLHILTTDIEDDE